MKGLAPYGILQIVLLLQIPLASFAQAELTSSNIPIISIETGSLEIADAYRIPASMGIISNEPGVRNNITDPYNGYEGQVSIEIRGATSQIFPKKSYGFETKDGAGENLNVTLLDLPAENDWILYGPYSDKSLVRNILAYNLSRKLGRYAPATKACELVLNGEYRGVYVLVEKIKRDRNRVAISKLEADDTSGDALTGGYIIKIDKTEGNSGAYWYSEIGGIGFQYEYPAHDEIVREQKDYIRAYIDSFERALLSDDFMDPHIGYRRYMDDSSIIDFFLVNELAKNVDAYMLSTFFYKDRDSKDGRLTMGPIWDFNLAFGNADYRDGYLTEGFQVSINSSPWWWGRLMEDTILMKDMRLRWQDVRAGQFSNMSIDAMIDSVSVLLDEAQERNFERWDILGKNIWPNYHVGESYEDEIKYLRDWIFRRLEWLDHSLSGALGPVSFRESLQARAYPNPFSADFSFDFFLDEPGTVSLILYDVYGKEESRIIDDRYYSRGTHTIDHRAPEGTGTFYLLVMRIDGEIGSVKKMVRL